MTPSLVRQALDELLRRYPFFDLVSIDWGLRSHAEQTSTTLSPWVLVELGQPSDDFEHWHAWAIHHFAIFKATGALFPMSPPSGPVSDDPIWAPNVGLPCERHPDREAVAKIGLPNPSRWACRECFAEFEGK